MSTEELRERFERLNLELLDLNASAARAIVDISKKGDTTFDPRRYETRKKGLEIEIENARSSWLRSEIPELKSQLAEAKQELKTVPPLKEEKAKECIAAKDILDQRMLEYGKLKLREYSLTTTIIQLNEDLTERKRELKEVITGIVNSEVRPSDNLLMRN